MRARAGATRLGPYLHAKGVDGNGDGAPFLASQAASSGDREGQYQGTSRPQPPDSRPPLSPQFLPSLCSFCSGPLSR